MSRHRALLGLAMHPPGSRDHPTTFVDTALALTDLLEPALNAFEMTFDGRPAGGRQQTY